MELMILRIKRNGTFASLVVFVVNETQGHRIGPHPYR